MRHPSLNQRSGLAFKRLATFGVLLASAVDLSACQKQIFKVGGQDIQANIDGIRQSLKSISGVLRAPQPAALALSSAEVDTSCAASPQVMLYRAAGDTFGKPLASAEVDAEGRFIFSDIASLDIALSQGQAYVLAFHNCEAYYSRVVTGEVDQDLTPGSTLVAYALASTDKAHATVEVSRLIDIANLSDQLAKPNSASAAYSSLISNSGASSLFHSVFNVDAAALKNMPPIIVSLTTPSSAAEREAAAFAVGAAHWDPSYKIAVLWKNDNDPVSSATNYTYTPSGNAQGTHVVSLYVGKAAAGSSELDTGSPYVTRSETLQVDDTLPATPPSFAVSGDVNGGQAVGGVLYSSSRELSLTLDTGEALSNCETFTALELTENVETAPVDTQAYKLKCTHSGTQTFSYTLQSAGDGVKMLRLWAIDASGNIGKTAVVRQVTLDTSTPAFMALPLANEAADGYLNALERSQAQPLVGAISGTGYDDVGYRLVPAATVCDGTLAYAAAIPQSNSDAFGADGDYKVCSQLTDLAGHAAAYGASPSFTLKEVAPVFTSVDLAGDVADNYLNATERQSAAVLVDNLVASGANAIGYGVASATTACTAVPTYVASIPTSGDAAFGGDGSYKVCIQLTDVAGNKAFGASSAFQLVTASLGAFVVTGPAHYTNVAAPTVAWSAAAGATTYELKIAATAACATPIQTYSSLTMTAQALTPLGDGDYYACVTGRDPAGNENSAAAYPFTVDTAAPGAFAVTAAIRFVSS